MVSRQGKDLLRNTIRSTDYHNRLLEEDDMWRQWDLERGLTMMVTDDCLKKKLRMDQYSRPMKSSLCDSNRDNYWTKKLFEVEKKDPDRWGHSGYKELYPEEFSERKARVSSPASSSDRRKAKRKDRSRHSRHRRKKHKRDSSPDSTKKSSSTTSHRKHHKPKVKKQPQTSRKESTTSDSSTTNSQTSETEEGECEKYKSDNESVKSDKTDRSSTTSESSIDERLQEEQLQRLARFRRHFRSSSIEKEPKNEKNGFGRELRGDAVLWSERIKAESNGSVESGRRKRGRKSSKAKKRRKDKD